MSSFASDLFKGTVLTEVFVLMNSDCFLAQCAKTVVRIMTLIHIDIEA